MTVDAIVYDNAGARQYDDIAEARDADGTTWIRVVDPDDAELGTIRDAFDIHHLETEDIQNGVRPKVDVFDDHAFVLIKEAELSRGETTFEEELREDPVGIFFGDGWVVTISLDRVEAVERARNAVDRGDTRVVARGADFTAYRIIDGIVDDYFGLLDEIEDDIELVEDEVIDAPDVGTLERIHSLRRELLSLRRLVWPVRDAVGVLARGDPDQVSEETEKYYRDAYDHLVQLVDLVETYRDLTGGARDIYLNSLSMSTNEVMKKLTVVATIVLPLTFIAGVYGMNFDGGPYNMPELGWDWGYPAVMLGMLVTALVMVSYFRREGWL
ncbi:magnesium/cobalt transporter CorA [Halostella pelagica]|uniref:magnesium/cobalt transporter CorA n=1 Tax=Halostella pelagica TaxID=2583824 RepID=UPI001081E825|nr:magnesium/cobalt transporter CorA [Halostella pelagica]